MQLSFKPGPDPDHFVHEAGAPLRLEFVRSAHGAVTAMRTRFGSEVELDPRHQPQDGLPSVEEVIALVDEAHGIARLPERGVVRLTGTVELEKRQIEGPFTTLFDASRFRDQIQLGEAEQIVVRNHGKVWTYATGVGVDQLDGQRLEQALLEDLTVRYGDWRQHYAHVEVLRRLEKGAQSMLLVRVVPKSGPGQTIVVDEASGLVRHIDSLQQIPGVGIVGVEIDFGDHRDVGGMKLPFRSRTEFASELIGRITTTVERAEVGIDVPSDAFAPPAAP